VVTAEVRPVPAPGAAALPSLLGTGGFGGRLAVPESGTVVLPVGVVVAVRVGTGEVRAGPVVRTGPEGSTDDPGADGSDGSGAGPDPVGCGLPDGGAGVEREWLRCGTGAVVVGPGRAG
jgi:hypothetical protein